MSDTYPSAAPMAARFDMGRVIRQTFGVIGRNIVSIGLLSVGFSILNVAVGFVIGLALGTVMPATAISLLASLVGIVVQGVLVSCLIFIVIADLNGRRPDIGMALQVALSVLLPVVALNIVLGLGVGIGIVLLVVPGLMLLTRWFVVVPVQVVESPGVGGSLSRSAELTSGYRWPILGLCVAYAVLFFAIGFVVVMLSGGLGQLVEGQAVLSPAYLVWQVISSSITAAIGSAGTAAIYVELRRIKEGAMPHQLASVFE